MVLPTKIVMSILYRFHIIFACVALCAASAVKLPVKAEEIPTGLPACGLLPFRGQIFYAAPLGYVMLPQDALALIIVVAAVVIVARLVILVKITYTHTHTHTHTQSKKHH
jgi:hypothetical protein